jgi:DNA-binding response OmpR family regulator
VRRLRAGSGEGDPSSSGELDLGELWMSLPARRVSVRGNAIDLSAREFDLLRILAINAGRVVSRRTLFDSVWGVDFFGDERALDVYIRFLRKKLERNPDQPTMIHTVRGVGYRLEPVRGG